MVEKSRLVDSGSPRLILLLLTCSSVPHTRNILEIVAATSLKLLVRSIGVIDVHPGLVRAMVTDPRMLSLPALAILILR